MKRIVIVGGREIIRTFDDIHEVREIIRTFDEIHEVIDYLQGKDKNDYHIYTLLSNETLFLHEIEQLLRETLQ